MLIALETVANFTLQPKKHLKHLGRLPRRLTFAQKEEFSRMIMGVSLRLGEPAVTVVVLKPDVDMVLDCHRC